MANPISAALNAVKNFIKGPKPSNPEKLGKDLRAEAMRRAMQTSKK